jgi:hypothetical protein
MNITQEHFSSLFSDQLNCLDLAFTILRSGLENSYSGKVEFDLEHSSSAFTSAHLHVSAECLLTWGNGWSDYAAKGRICWTTTSGHEVLFEFDREENGEVNLIRVLIADDESKTFYPWIREVCARNSIVLEIKTA